MRKIVLLGLIAAVAVAAELLLIGFVPKSGIVNV